MLKTSAHDRPQFARHYRWDLENLVETQRDEEAAAAKPAKIHKGGGVGGG